MDCPNGCDEIRRTASAPSLVQHRPGHDRKQSKVRFEIKPEDIGDVGGVNMTRELLRDEN